jgi:hypothetical protein
MKTLLITAAALASVIGMGAQAIAYDGSEVTRTYHADVSFLTGQPGVWEHSTGKLHLQQKSELVGYYGGGHPRAIGFGCEGAKMPVIAMEESDLPICKRVEPITYPGDGKMLETA